MTYSIKTLRYLSLWVVILALTLTIMLPGLDGGFLFDDTPNIVENHAIQIHNINIESLRSSLNGPTAGPLGRTISVLSFAITHYFFGLDPFAFKAINLAIHIINGLLVAWLVTLLLRAAPNLNISETTRTWLSLWVAAAWLVHPINIMPVMQAVQRMTLLSGMFMLLALISHLTAISTPYEKKKYRVWLAVGWTIFWPLSILSKETGLLFPFYILAITQLTQPSSTSHLSRKSWVIPLALFLLLITGVTMLSFLGWGWLETAYSMRPFSLTERLLTEARVLWFYAAQITIPNYASFGPYLDDFTLSKGMLRPTTTLFSAIGWSTTILAIWRLRHTQPIPCFAAAWFLIGHSLESTFLPLEIAHEYRNYIPSIGLVLGVGYLGTTILSKLKLDHRSLIVGSLAITAVLTLALFTWLRASQMNDPLLSAQIEATRHPQSARANHAAALALIKAGFGDASDPIAGQNIQFYFQQSEKLDPTFKFGYLGLIVWSCGSGRTLDRIWIDNLSDRLEHTPFAPKDRALPDLLFKPLLNMPTCLNRKDALKLFLAGASNNSLSNSMRARFLEAAADYELLVSHDLSSARRYLTMSSELTPHDLALRIKLDSFEYPKIQIKP